MQTVNRKRKYFFIIIIVGLVISNVSKIMETTIDIDALFSIRGICYRDFPFIIKVIGDREQNSLMESGYIIDLTTKPAYNNFK